MAMTKASKTVALAIVLLVVLFCAGSLAFDKAALDETYARHAEVMPLMLTDAEVAADHPYRDVSFELDGCTIRGHVYGDSDDARGLVVFRHGIFSQHQDYLALITALVDRGWKVFAYDAMGCGESDGDSVRGFAQAPIDVHAAVRYARDSGMAGDLPVMLVGHSWGGYGVAGALDFGDDVAGCVSMSGFDTPEGIIVESAAEELGVLAETQRPFIRLLGWLDFGADADRSAARAIGESGTPVLVVHGTEDGTVRYGGSSIIAQREQIANQNARYITKDEPGRNGHNTYFYSPESQAYLAECQDGLDELQARWNGEVPQDELDAYLAGIDKRRANTADPALIDEIDSFLTSCVQQR